MAKRLPKKRTRIESYVAHKSVKASASAKAVQSAYKIEVRFLGGLTATQKNAFKKAADRWSRVIIGDLPSVLVGGEVIDDLLIEAQGVDDRRRRADSRPGRPHQPAARDCGSERPAARQGHHVVRHGRPRRHGSRRHAVDVITHEMGHVIGIGTIWEDKGLLAGAGINEPAVHRDQREARLRPAPRHRAAPSAGREHRAALAPATAIGGNRCSRTS